MIPETGIAIEWLEDSYDCDTCGCSFAEGARVYKDGKVIINLKPSAHCYSGQTWTREEIYLKIFEMLGFNVYEV